MPEQLATTSEPVSGHATLTPQAPSARSVAFLGYLDLVLLAAGVPVALVLGAPAFGALVGAGGWLLQRAAAVVDRGLIMRSAQPGSRLGLNFIDAFGRIWLLAGAIVIAGAVGSRRDGLTAAVLVLAAYSIAFAIRLARGREGGPQ